MPGPIAHLAYGIGLGLSLRSVSEGRFSDLHSLVYAVNCFFGPDVGAIAEWTTRQLGIGHEMGTRIFDLAHSPFLYPLCMAPLAALAWYCLLTCRVVYCPGAARCTAKYKLATGRPGLSWLQCWALCAAGGLSHFALDIPFEMNGHDPMYAWILSTGYWENAYVDGWCLVTIGALTTVLLLGFLLANANSTGGPLGPPGLSQSSLSSVERSQVIATGRLLWAVTAIYFGYLLLRTYLIGGPRVPVAGEEADLGVLVYVVYFFLLPLLMLSASCNSSWVLP